jgi:hypothetical protein
MRYSLDLRDDAVIDSVRDDFESRKVIGQETYGVPLTEAKIDGLQYAYEEALDLAIYLKYEIIKRKEKDDKSK